jgi:hypothetical protein
LWWRGLNIAQDAGTYLYNAPPPWDYPLANTVVHNTITIDEQNQMTRASRFLWLDWAQAQIVEHPAERKDYLGRIVAQHDGYHHIGVVHQREVYLLPDSGWIIEDSLQSLHPRRTLKSKEASFSAGDIHQFRLHWLLPDWSWNLEDQDSQFQYTLQLRSPHGWIALKIGIESATLFHGDLNLPSIQVTRAGECLSGSGPIAPYVGWVSPTYGSKLPAISFSVSVESYLPIKFVSQWLFPEVQV